MALARESDIEACEADISCSPQQIDSESDNRPLLSKISRTSNKNPSSTTSNETDSSYYGNRLPSLPTKSSNWNIYCLESLGIFYNESYHSSPLDILNIIFQEVKIFGPLNKEQMANVESMQKCMTFSTSVNDMIQHKANIVQNEHLDIYLPGLEKDIQNLSVPALHDVDDFVRFLVSSFLGAVQLMISCQAAFIYRLRQTGVPKEVFVDIVKTFSQMCDILPVPGSAKKCTMNIKATTVKSASDVVLIPKRYRNRAFGVDTACVVSVVEVEGEKQSVIFKQHRNKVRKMRSATDSSDSESCVSPEPAIYQKRCSNKLTDNESCVSPEPAIYQKRCSNLLTDSESHVSPEPAIYQKLCSNILGQHGGELLVHRNIYCSGLSIGKIWKYLPGMICVGTEVIFTLLKINSTHLNELETMAKTDTKATIYYSEPKDMLKKEDRDILLEAFTRLSNIDITSD